MTMIDELLAAPVGHVIEELRSVRAERRTLDSKEALLERLADLIVARGGEDARAIEEYRDTLLGGTLREQILQIMRSNVRKAQWVPRELVSGLAQRGTEVTLDHARVTMRRMAESGELLKPKADKLLFRLPAEPRNARG